MAVNQQKKRKLPKSMRRANFMYKIIMGCLAGINLIFASLSFVPSQYFEVCSVLTSAFPVAWSYILDAAKQYEEEATPTVQSPSTEQSIDEAKINEAINPSSYCMTEGLPQDIPVVQDSSQQSQ